MFRDNSLVPVEAIRLAALGTLAEGPLHYADLASRIRQFIGEMHQLKDERAVLRLHASEVLARLDHHLGNADLVCVLERLTQKRVGFIAAFLRLKIVRLIKEHWIDLFLIDEVLNIYCLRCFQINDPRRHGCLSAPNAAKRR